eukprot:m.135908 g.135908  ORF g.135908 m.135908 type:complete len:733 (+) comp14719_c0_seq2:170-2368(+)
MSKIGPELKKAVNSILDDLRSQSSKRQYRGTSKVSKLLRAPQRELAWESDQVIDAVVKAGAVPRLTEFLERFDDHKLQSEAANALANISAGTSENTCAVIQAGVVPIATRLLASSSTDLQDHAAWLLANIACENCTCVLDAGALAPLLKLLDNARQNTQSEQSLIKTGTWLLSNLCQYTEDFDRVKDCLPRLAALIHSSDEAVLKDGCWGLMYICRLSIDAVVESGACEPLVKLLMHSSDEVCCVALEALSAIFGNGGLHHKERIMEYNVLPRLRYLLYSRRERTREIACTALVNLIRNGQKLLHKLRDQDIFLCLIQIVGRTATSRAGWLTWREAVRALCGVVDCAIQSSPEIIKYLVGHGLIFSLSHTVQDAANTSMELCLDPVLRIVELLIESGRKLYEKGNNHGEHGCVNCSCQPDPTIDPGEPNPYKDFIADCGLADTLSFTYLAKIWQAGYPNNGKCHEALPSHLERMCSRVHALMVTKKEAVPSLKSLARRTLRRFIWMDSLYLLKIPMKEKAYILGLEEQDVKYIGIRSTCAIGRTLRMKEVGDKEFISGNYPEAAANYTQALDLIKNEAIEALKVTLLLNRSAAYLKWDRYDLVLKDCNDALKISPQNLTCLQRRALAYEKNGQYQNALDDFLRLKGEEAEIAQGRLKGVLAAKGLGPPEDRDMDIEQHKMNCPHQKLGNGTAMDDDGDHKQDHSFSEYQKEFSFATLKSLQTITNEFLRDRL